MPQTRTSFLLLAKAYSRSAREILQDFVLRSIINQLINGLDNLPSLEVGEAGANE